MRTLTRNRFRKKAVGLASIFAFLLLVGTAPFALAASDWPTWPPKKVPPQGSEGVPADEAAAKAGASTGRSVFAGISSGTLGWAAAIIGAGVLIGVAAGGGGGSTTNH